MNDSTNTYSRMFSGKRLLIVEDQYFLAEKTRQKLLELSATIIGPVSNIGHALELIAIQDVDVAILDVQLDPALVFPLVETLEKLKLPYVFAVGSEPFIAQGGFAGFVLCEKASELEHIAKALFAERRQDI